MKRDHLRGQFLHNGGGVTCLFWPGAAHVISKLGWCDPDGSLYPVFFQVTPWTEHGFSLHLLCPVAKKDFLQGTENTDRHFQFPELCSWEHYHHSHCDVIVTSALWWPNLAQNFPGPSLIPLRFQGISLEKSFYHFKFNMSKAKFMTAGNDTVILLALKTCG